VPGFYEQRKSLQLIGIQLGVQLIATQTHNYICQYIYMPIYCGCSSIGISSIC